MKKNLINLFAKIVAILSFLLSKDNIEKVWKSLQYRVEEPVKYNQCGKNPVFKGRLLITKFNKKNYFKLNRDSFLFIIFE